jgi:hypothetical protein
MIPRPRMPLRNHQKLSSRTACTYVFIATFLLALVTTMWTYPTKLHNAQQQYVRQQRGIDTSELEATILNVMIQADSEAISSIYANYSDESSILLDIQTPQGRAFHWLLHHDKYTHEHRHVSDEDIVQRYVLILLFFCTEGRYNDNFASEFTAAANVRALWSNYGELGFLSNKKHECSWNVKIKGVVYGVVCSKGKVEELQLGGVGLDGFIPYEIGLLSTLKRIELQDNHLKETIPSSFGMLEKLQVLNVEGNLLVGPIPEELSFLANLESLFLHSNRIHGGEVPATVCKLMDQKALLEFWMDCGQLVDPILCHCCTRCCSDDYCVTSNSWSHNDDYEDTEDRIDAFVSDLQDTAITDAITIVNTSDTGDGDGDDFEDVDTIELLLLMPQT